MEMQLSSPTTTTSQTWLSITNQIPDITHAIVTNASDINNNTGNATTNSTGLFDIPPGCKPLVFDGFVPWDNPDSIISVEVEAFCERLKGAIVLPILFLIGGPANVINMVVFYKHGLKERINLCLFALSLADELYLIECVFLNGENMYRQFIPTTGRNGPVFAFIVNNKLNGFFGFCWVSFVMSAIIASERCFCVLSPLRSQTVLTTRTMAVIIVAVFVVVTGMYFVVVSRYSVGCVYDPDTGVSFMMLGDGGEFYHRNKVFLDYLDSMVYGLGLPGLVMMVAAVTTAVTTYQLKKAQTWRSESSRSALSSREVALTKMLIGNSILFIVCVSPNFPFRLCMILIPELNPGRRQQNIFLAILWLMEITSYINSIVIQHRHLLRHGLQVQAHVQVHFLQMCWSKAGGESK